MNLARAFAELSPTARKTFVASFLGWTLDAFDFFLLTFVVTRIAGDFRRGIPDVAFAITLTLMCRPLGALIFGWVADRFGRRTPLMIDIALYSALELATAFAPSFTVFLVLRGLYGVAMGGEWGLGAALAMEALPTKDRGLFSGILQEGYMVGYLLAALAFFAVMSWTPWGWRGLFVIGALPALLILYVRSQVPESAAWLATRRRAAPRVPWSQSLRGHLLLIVYAIAFMAAFNFLSHGTQDLYATFLEKQRGLAPAGATAISALAAVGAIVGGICAGAFSQRFGRRYAIIACAVIGAALIPLWAFAPTAAWLALGGFAMQFMVQGAWGVIPAHLNELSPAGMRGTFPGFTYQIGNLISAGAAQLEASFAQSHFALPGGGANYGAAMATIAAIVFASVIVLTAVGYAVKPERRDAAFVPEAAAISSP